MEQYGKFKTLDEVYAVILGKIKRDYPTIQRSVFNKILVGFELDKVDKSYFLMLVDRVKSSNQLSELYLKAVRGVYTLDDIKIYDEDSVSENGLFDLVSSYTVDKYTTQAQTTNFRKAQRQGTAQYYLSQQIAQQLKESLVGIDKPVQPKALNVDSTDKQMIMALSDWHIGARVDNVNGNSYNIDIAKRRLKDYLDKAHQEALLNKPSHVFLYHGGDFIEGIDMRKVNQSFDAEVDATTQIAVATRMMIDAVREVSSWGIPTTVALVGGNHDRYTSNKKDAIYNDNIAYNVVDTLILIKGYGIIPEYVDIVDNRTDIYRAETVVAGQNVMLIHGDTLPSNDKPKIPMLIKDHPINLVIYGHYHSSRFIQENGSGFAIMVGSLMGNNTYSKQLLLPDSKPSQLIMFVSVDSSTPTFEPVFID